MSRLTTTTYFNHDHTLPVSSCLDLPQGDVADPSVCPRSSAERSCSGLHSWLPCPRPRRSAICDGSSQPSLPQRQKRRRGATCVFQFGEPKFDVLISRARSLPPICSSEQALAAWKLVGNPCAEQGSQTSYTFNPLVFAGQHAGNAWPGGISGRAGTG